MRTIDTRMLALYLMAAVATGCTTSSDGGKDNGDANGNGGGATGGVMLALGDAGSVELRGSAAAMTKQFNVSSQLPTATPSSAAVTLKAKDVSVAPLGDSAEPINAEIILQLFWDRPDAPASCGSFPEHTRFDVVVEDGTVTTITPSSGAVDSNPFSVVATGEFGVCVTATANADLRLTIDELLLEYE